MSQPELVAALRSARPVAPPELRERVRLVAAGAADSSGTRRRLTWRHALGIAVPVAAAVAAAVVLYPRSNGPGAPTPRTAAPPVERAAAHGAVSAAAAGSGAFKAAASDTAAAPYRALPAPSASRPQKYSASLSLRVDDPAAVSAASKRATAIVAALGGFPSSLNVDAGRSAGYANLVFRVPRTKVELAVRRLSSLGTIVGENVRIQDLGAQVSAADRTLQRLRKQLATQQAQPQTTEVEQRIASLEAQIAKRQRARAATLRATSLATVTVQLTSPAPKKAAVVHHGHGPLHGLGVAFRWLGIGAAYALALGLPFVLLGLVIWLVARIVRRRREDALLSRS
jgi:hypothetical protein